jgi:hypothetical protein
MYELDLIQQMIYSPFSIERLITGVFGGLGIWLDIRLLWMVIYEYRKKGDGEKYLKYGKKLSP